MKRSIILYASFLLSLCLLSCEQEPTGAPEEPAAGPLFARAQVFGSEIEGFRYFDFVAGEDVALAAGATVEVFWENDYPESEEGPSLFTGAVSREPGADPLFGLQFWPEALAGSPGLSRDEVETFFAPGRVFEFGRGAGKVDLYVRLPEGQGVMEHASLASFLTPYEINGNLEITAAEDYTCQTTSGEVLSGKRVSCRFFGLVGHHTVRTAMDDGAPGLDWDDLKVVVRYGEAAFFVACQ